MNDINIAEEIQRVSNEIKEMESFYKKGCIKMDNMKYANLCMYLKILQYKERQLQNQK